MSTTLIVKTKNHLKPKNIETHISLIFRVMSAYLVVSEKFSTIHRERMRVKKTTLLRVYIIAKITPRPQFENHGALLFSGLAGVNHAWK